MLGVFVRFYNIFSPCTAPGYLAPNFMLGVFVRFYSIFSPCTAAGYLAPNFMLGVFVRFYNIFSPLHRTGLFSPQIYLGVAFSYAKKQDLIKALFTWVYTEEHRDEVSPARKASNVSLSAGLEPYNNLDILSISAKLNC